MKCKSVSAVLAGVFALGLVVSAVTASYAEDDGCSLVRSAGKFAFTDSGTVVGVGPRTAVGVVTLDGAGNVINASATSSLNGNIAVETFTGTYTVNSDCTTTFSVKIFASGVEILDLTMSGAFDDHMKEIRAIFTSVTTPTGTVLPTVVNLVARKQ